jgi:hypothetical protein
MTNKPTTRWTQDTNLGDRERGPSEKRLERRLTESQLGEAHTHQGKGNML